MLGSKLTLLALHFPRLRIIWSRSLHATADIFRALKANQDDPDPLIAAAVGEHLSSMQCLPYNSFGSVICGLAGFSIRAGAALQLKHARHRSIVGSQCVHELLSHDVHTKPMSSE